MARLITFLALSAVFAACGDDIKTRERHVYVDENGEPVDQNGDATAGDPTVDPAAGNTPGNVIDNAPVTAPGTTLQGALVSVNSLGLVQGWAVNTADLNATVNITLYLGNDADNGVELASVDAKLAGFDNNNAGNHRFEYQLAAANCDGAEKKLFVKMSQGTQSGSLTKVSQAYTAYAPKAAGQQFYANNLLSALQNNCGSCHPNEVNYNNHYRLLLDAPPASGGTATTNRLIVKASGGMNHGGGNRCGGINQGVCAQFQQWWSAEFQ